MQFARDFCIGQWMSDLYAELDKASKLEDEEEANDAKLQEEAQSKKKFLRSLLKVKPSEATKYILTSMYTFSWGYCVSYQFCSIACSHQCSKYLFVRTYIHLHV